MATTFERWFASLTGHTEPRPWQSELTGDPTFRDRLIRIGTGLGKTEGVLSAWMWHRLNHDDPNWPRRLVWCLPMRVLVEQTEQVARDLVKKLPLPEERRPTVHVAMGGEDAGEWFLYPERPAIIIGTQDMLLSRALNRGYASPRARWPMEFGLLNHDALWVMDEIQLMDIGLATSAQLQAFREEDREKHLRPCHTWWMSATLQSDWLCSVDTKPHHANWVQNLCTIAPTQRSGGLWAIHKSLTTEPVGPQDNKKFAKLILDAHNELPAGEFGRITLVVCNTVDRACRTFDALRDAGRTVGLELVHSRFRPAEREGWRHFLSRSACTSEVDRIIVATQVIEAGVDISAGCLITELAPWPSLVQRFGRCARYGGSGKVVVVDRGSDKAAATPYQSQELESAREATQELTERGVGIAALDAYEDSLTQEARLRLYPYSPDHLLLRREFDELFDTTPDLTGADLDISRFIRSGDERDVQVFWLDLGKDEEPQDNRRPHRRALCSVPFLRARDWLCEKGKSKLKANKRAWVWDWLDGEWKPVTSEALLPGRVVCVAANSGGYSIERGFSPDSTSPVSVPPLEKVDPQTESFDEADDHQDGEQLSVTHWKTIACHADEVAQASRDIAQQLDLSPETQDILELAAICHDWGKSHPAFQGVMRGTSETSRPQRFDLAKGPEDAWRRGQDMYRYLDDNETRPAFRHELASALGLFAILQTFEPKHPALLGPWSELPSEIQAKLGFSPASSDPPALPSPLIERIVKCSPEAFDLLAYLVASHHGRVRVGLHAAPKDQEYRDHDGRGLPIRGVREGDRLPSVELAPGEPIPEVVLTLSPATLGLSCQTGISWRQRCLGVIERYGPAALAFLEAVLRAADVRASRLNTNDPALATEVSV